MAPKKGASEAEVQAEAPEQPIPVPPFTGNEDPASGLQCYYDGCPYVAYKWSRMFEHVRQKHEQPMEAHIGTPLYKLGREGLSEEHRNRDNAKRAAARAKASQAAVPAAAPPSPAKGGRGGQNLEA